MPKNLGFIALFLPIILAASCRSQAPRAYFNRPVVVPIISAPGSTGFQDGQEVDNSGNICYTLDGYDTLEKYGADKEERLYFCLRFGECK